MRREVWSAIAGLFVAVVVGGLMQTQPDRRRPARPPARWFRERWFIRPVQDFLRTEVAGGAMLLGAALLALAVANSELASEYREFWGTELTLGLSGLSISLNLQHWVNDLLMAIFFFVVAMEIKRELVVGELRHPRLAALPVMAALGGMVVPAGIYLLFNAGTDVGRGWGIPMATDIAFAAGMMALFSKRIPAALKTFLLTLAVVDDLGAIAVIAVYYSEGVDLTALALAGAVFAIGAVMLLAGVSRAWPFLLLAPFLWVATFESGVHATIAGVALATLIPARLRDPGDYDERPTPLSALEHRLHPLTSFVIVPVFAFANAGVSLDVGDLGEAFSDRLGLGIIGGLVVGKLLGITAFAWFAQRTGIGQLHPSLRIRHIALAAAVAGIGFTVSLFITELAFDSVEVIDAARVAVLLASLAAACVGALLLLVFGESRGRSPIRCGRPAAATPSPSDRLCGRRGSATRRPPPGATTAKRAPSPGARKEDV
ncbi:MAG: Na+/H+ antiporter NhaA [Dehalococcoidia bacterium]|nr:Na+/H+ antiporter NhaA [Dehalococcoidia bacterium]